MRRGYAALGEEGGAGSSAPNDEPSGSGTTRPAQHASAVRPRARATARVMDAVFTKLQAAAWVGLTVLTVHYSKIMDVALHDARVYSFFLFLGLACTGVTLAIYTYLVIYLPYIARLQVVWDVYAPNMIPTATASMVISSLSYMLAFWDVYGLLTPLMMAVAFMGFINVFHFIPVP